MNLWPIIERELRGEARNPITQWVRLMGAGVMLLAATAFFEQPRPAHSGQELFAQLHQFLFITIWILVPMTTADCISREKRDATLGLLFLTPLKAGEIMMAKVLAHGLRAATFCVAVAPVLVLPLLLGGVSWSTVAASLLTNASAFFWALAAGLIASVLSRSLFAGLALAFAWAAVFLVVLSLLNGIAVFALINIIGQTWRTIPSAEWLGGMGLLAQWNAHRFLEAILGGMPAGTLRIWLAASGTILLASLAGLLVVWKVGAWRLHRVWQEAPRSRQREQLEQELSRPRIARKSFQAYMRWRMEKNPVGWLERRSWTSRGATWAWLGVLIVGYSFLLISSPGIGIIGETRHWVVLGLAGAVAVASCASFRRERETGVMELLLTTPLSPEQIVRGRLEGIWSQFIPSLLLVIGVMVYADLGMEWSSRLANTFVELGVAILLVLTIPVCGLWLSLGFRLFITSLLVTLGLTVFLPLFWLRKVMEAEYSFGPQTLSSPFSPMIPFCLSLAIGGAWALRRSLGWTGWLLCLTLFSTLLAIPIGWTIFSPETVHRWPPVSQRTPIVLMMGPQLALAGFAHACLLRNLHRRTFAFKS